MCNNAFEAAIVLHTLLRGIKGYSCSYSYSYYYYDRRLRFGLISLTYSIQVLHYSSLFWYRFSTESQIIRLVNGNVGFSIDELIYFHRALVQI